MRTIKIIQSSLCNFLKLSCLIIGLLACQLLEQKVTQITGTNSNGGGINRFQITQSNGLVNFSNQYSFSMLGNCSEQGSIIKMMIGPLTNMTSCNQGTFGFTIDLSGANDGTFTFFFEETVTTGTKYTTIFTTTKDTIIPIVSSIPDDGVPVSSKTLFWSCDKLCNFRYVVSTSAFIVPTNEYGTETQVTVNTGVERYYLHVQAKDVAGNESLIETAYFYIDENLPAAMSATAPPPYLGESSVEKLLAPQSISSDYQEGIITYGTSQMTSYEQTACPTGWQARVPEEFASGAPPLKKYCQKL